MNKVKVGVLGCGNISPAYLRNFKTIHSDTVEVAACADRTIENARLRAAEFGIPKACSIAQLLEDPELEIILDLTVPQVHYQNCMQALDAGKNVYVEKPMCVTREEAQKIMEKAGAKGLLLCGAPDTFMGAASQACRKLIDEGAIGEPVAATAFFTCHGYENWHPNPEFFYKSGGGPLLDRSVYQITALVNLLGPVVEVKSSSRMTFPQRVVTSKPRAGQIIDVEVPTHITSILDFKNGAVGTLIASFDIWAAKLPYIEIHGTEGSINVANLYKGPVLIFKKGASEWEDVPVVQNYSQDSRGLGVVDMAYSLCSGKKPRAGNELTYHVLDIMLSAIESAEQKAYRKVESTCSRPDYFDGINFL